jgi:predicted MFS family arabinose efflux permease
MSTQLRTAGCAAAGLGPRIFVILALSLAPAVSNSFARFAYALVLPAMRADLHLSYSQAGALNTANALGYLAGAFLCASFVSRLGNRRLFSAGIVVTVLALVGAGLTRNLAAQMLLRALAGVGGAPVFICGAVLASAVYPDRADLSSKAIGIYFGGAGAGILLTGAGIPWLLALGGDGVWRETWLVIGGVSAICAAVSIRAARRVDEPPAGPSSRAWPLAAYGAALGGYFLFGVGYIAYITFVVAWMVSHGAGALEVSLTWGMLGVSTLISPLLWRGPRVRFGAARSFAAASVVVGIGAAIPLTSTSLPAMMLSAFVFGSAWFNAPTAVTELVKTSQPKAAWSSAIAVFTVVFAAGQAIGPLLTGWLADVTPSLYASLEVSAVILIAAGAVGAWQRESRSKAGPRTTPSPLLLASASRPPGRQAS